MWWWLAACDEDPERDPAPRVPADPPCAVADDNALRIVCRHDGGQATLAVDDGGPVRTFEGGPGEVTAWNLPEATLVGLSLSVDGRTAWEGRVATGTVPDDGALSFVELVPGAPRAEHLLFSTTCVGGPPRSYVTDAHGAVRWYQPSGVTGGLTGFDDSQDGVVVLAGRRWVRELRWDGSLGLDAERDANADAFVHHAVDVEGDRVAVLDTRPRAFPDGRTYLDDGVAEVRDGEIVNVFRLGDHLDPQGRTGFAPAYWWGTFPDAIDAFHVNAVDLLPEGGFLLSIKHFDAIVKVDAAGEVAWAVTGSSFSPDLGALDLEKRGDGVAFEFPHHVNLAPWGNVLLFDNGRTLTPSSVVELAIDEAARTVRTVRRWELGVACPVQSSAYGLPDGTVVATCAGRREVFELDDDGIRRRVRVDCANGDASGLLVRAKPIGDF